MLESKHLAWLADIADLGSMSRAAQKLHISQPTLSRGIQMLEDHVGGKVLERERHGVRPTKIGADLAEQGRRIANAQLQAADIVGLWQDGLDRHLRVGVGAMLAATVMGRFFANTINNAPRYGLRVFSATTSYLVDQLNQGEFDVVLAPQQINLYQENLVQADLMADELAIFCRHAHPLHEYKQKLTPALLEQQTWISVGAFSGIPGSGKEVLSLLGVRDVSSRLAFTGDIMMALEILQTIDAVCVLPRKLVRMSPRMKELRALEVSVRLPSRNIACWSRRDDRDRPEIIDFRNRVATYLEQISEEHNEQPYI